MYHNPSYLSSSDTDQRIPDLERIAQNPEISACLPVGRGSQRDPSDKPRCARSEAKRRREDDTEVVLPVDDKKTREFLLRVIISVRRKMPACRQAGCVSTTFGHRS